MVNQSNLLTSISTNQYFNKCNAQLQSIKDKLLIKSITNQVRDYLNKTAGFMVNHCIQNSIANLIVGYNPGIKQEINIGGRNNQNFVKFPFHSLRSNAF